MEIKKGIADTIYVYPSHVALDVGFNTFLEDEGFTGLIRIHDIWKGVEVSDFSNKINTTIANDQIIALDLDKDILKEINVKSLIFGIKGKEINYILDFMQEKYMMYKHIYYTLILISVESNKEEYNEPIIQKKIDSLLNKFIEIYQYVTHNPRLRTPINLNYNESYIKLISFYEYSENDANLEHKDRLKTPRAVKPSLKSWNIDNHEVVNLPDKIFDENMKSSLIEYCESGKTVPITGIMLNKASEEFKIRKNWKYAFIESFLAIEYALNKFITDFKIKRNIPIDNFQITLAYQLNVELLFIIGAQLDEKDISLLREIDSMRKKRNKIVHGNQDVTHDDAINSIVKATDFINLLNSFKDIKG